jgi:hypothetical protein
MTKTEYARKLDELDRLLNDPDDPLKPSRVWSLLADIHGKNSGSIDPEATRNPTPHDR